MDKREQRKAVAGETVRIVQEGWYTADKKKVNIKQGCRFLCEANRILFG